MPRGVIDHEGMRSSEILALKAKAPPRSLPFNIRKIGHVVLMVQDIERSTEFYTQVLGFRISDAYPDTMMPGRMVFMRCNNDHHGVALIGGAKAPGNSQEMNHMAFEVATLDEVFLARDHLRDKGVRIIFEGRRRAGCQVAVEFLDPDNHILEIYWGIDQVDGNAFGRPPEEWREEMSLEDAVDRAPPGQDTTLKDLTLRQDTT